MLLKRRRKKKKKHNLIRGINFQWACERFLRIRSELEGFSIVQSIDFGMICNRSNELILFDFTECFLFPYPPPFRLPNIILTEYKLVNHIQKP